MKKILIELQERYSNYKKHKYMQGNIARLYNPSFYLFHSVEYCQKKEREQITKLRQMLDDYQNQISKDTVS